MYTILFSLISSKIKLLYVVGCTYRDCLFKQFSVFVVVRELLLVVPVPVPPPATAALKNPEE